MVRAQPWEPGMPSGTEKTEATLPKVAFWGLEDRWSTESEKSHQVLEVANAMEKNKQRRCGVESHF